MVEISIVCDTQLQEGIQFLSHAGCLMVVEGPEYVCFYCDFSYIDRIIQHIHEDATLWCLIGAAVVFGAVGLQAV
jgi:hypothetical protein